MQPPQSIQSPFQSCVAASATSSRNIYCSIVTLGRISHNTLRNVWHTRTSTQTLSSTRSFRHFVMESLNRKFLSHCQKTRAGLVLTSYVEKSFFYFQDTQFGQILDESLDFFNICEEDKDKYFLCDSKSREFCLQISTAADDLSVASDVCLAVPVRVINISVGTHVLLTCQRKEMLF